MHVHNLKRTSPNQRPLRVYSVEKLSDRDRRKKSYDFRKHSISASRGDRRFDDLAREFAHCAVARIFRGLSAAFQFNSKIASTPKGVFQQNWSVAAGAWKRFWKVLCLRFGSWWMPSWALASMAPRQVPDLGQMVSSDGLALLEIPRATPQKLQVYLMAAPMMRTLSCFETGDFSGAQAWATTAPGDGEERVAGGIPFRVDAPSGSLPPASAL